MDIILSGDDFWKNQIKNNFWVSLILSGEGSCMYLLIKDIGKELEEFILGGKAEATELHVFTAKQEKALISKWKGLGMEATYHSQQIEYMYRRVTVTYLRVRDPASDSAISLIPWFMIPGRPFPVFIYVYAIWHYQKTGGKSLRESAAAAGKLFGIKRLNKSTVSRNIKAMGEFIDIAHIDRPLAVEEPERPSDWEMIGLIPEILRGELPIESLALPAPVNRAKASKRALSGIPVEFSRITKDRGPCSEKKARDSRKRPARARGKRLRRVQRQPEFVGFQQIEKTRIAFIGICRAIVLDAASTYHRFLI